MAAVLSFVAAIAIVGTYTFRDYRQTQKENALALKKAELAKAEETEKSEAANADKIVNYVEDSANKDASRQSKSSDGTGRGGQPGSSDSGKGTSDGAENAGTDDAASPTAGNSQNVNFTSNSKLLWPVKGNILMNYSMDKTVYFSTLDQYKYNPALVISGAEGDQVIASAPGIVKSIDKTAQTGTTVNVDIGGGYELFYGQLKEVPVKTGDHVDSKTVLGYVSQPTKYYSVEGCNVYFEMRKDGQPVNPMEYLVE